MDPSSDPPCKPPSNDITHRRRGKRRARNYNDGRNKIVEDARLSNSGSDDGGDCRENDATNYEFAVEIVHLSR